MNRENRLITTAFGLCFVIALTVGVRGQNSGSFPGGGGAGLGANTFTALQTITQASANAGVIASTGYSLTGSNATNMIDLAGTWNTSGQPTAIKVSIVNTASPGSSKLLELFAGSSGTTSEFSVTASGNATASGAYTGASFNTNVNTGYLQFNTHAYIQGAGTDGFISVNNNAGTQTAFLGAPANATLQLGTANAASPVAQTVRAQGSRSGTDSNVGGGNLTVTAGNGTGNGAISSLILQSPVAVGSGTGAQTQTTGLTIKGGQAVLAGPYTVATLPTGITGGMAYVTDAVACTFLATLTGGGSAFCPVVFNGAAWVGA